MGELFLGRKVREMWVNRRSCAEALVILCFASICSHVAAENPARIAAEFDGINDYLRAPSLHLPSQVLSLQFWFKPLQKTVNGHLESCLLSQGSWKDRKRPRLTPFTN